MALLGPALPGAPSGGGGAGGRRGEPPEAVSVRKNGLFQSSIAKLGAHGTSPQTGGKRSLRGLSPLRGCSSLDFLLATFAARLGGQNARSPSPRGAQRAQQARPTGRARPPRRERRRDKGGPGRPQPRPRAPPQTGGSTGTRRAAGRPGRREQGRPPAREAAVERRPGRTASTGGAGRPRRSGRARPRARRGPRPTPARARAPPGPQWRKKPRGAGPYRARQRGTSGPGAGAHTLEGLGTPARRGPGAQPGEERGPERRAHPRERAAGPPDEPGRCVPGLLMRWVRR